MLWCSFGIGPPRLKRDLIQPLVKLRLCCDFVRACMPLASCQGRLTIYSREMVNIPRDKLGGIVMPSALCRILRPEWPAGR